MNRLNYFNPYDSKAGSHEDQLTRAYLVLLRHSCHAFFVFFEFARSKHKTASKEKSFTIIEFLERGWDIETQKGNPVINTDYLLSVLITDSDIATAESSVQSSDRNARYDGIITFGSDLTMVIENKPRSGNVWFGQLNPSRQNLAEGTQVYSNPIVLEWKEIIKQLNHLLSFPTISGYEKLMIEDFLSYIDENFPSLNPYDSFHQCKGNVELINRRIYNLLKSLALDESKVKYHRGWGYYVETPYPQIQQIGLIFYEDEKDSCFELSFYFGDSQRQAISFYNSNPNISHLNSSDWYCHPNFHVSFMTSNLVWIKLENTEHYLQFWKDNVNEIYQQKRKDVPNYLKWLADEKVIEMTKEAEEQLKERFYDTAMQTLNVCPGFGVIHTFSFADAEMLDRDGKLKFVIAERIKEALKIVGVSGDELLKKL